MGAPRRLCGLDIVEFPLNVNGKSCPEKTRVVGATGQL